MHFHFISFHIRQAASWKQLITVADVGRLPEKKQSPKKESHGENYTASNGTYYQEKNDRSGPGTSC